MEALSDELREANLSETRLRLGLQPIYSILVTSGVVAVVWLGGRNVVRGLLTTGSLVAFLQLYIRFVVRGYRIPLFFNRIQSAGVAYGRLEQMLAPASSNDGALPEDGEPRCASFKPGHITGIDQPPPAPPRVPTGPLGATISELVFRYPGSDHTALNGIDLAIPPGSLTAITGPIGSGKTALLQLMAGLYEPTAGTLMLGDRPVSEWPGPERSLRVAYLPQEPGLFSGTIRENIGLDDTEKANPAIEAEIVRRAGLERDVAAFPQGLDTRIGEGGIRISGGQRQRIALARALAVGSGRTPGILLLDDPFASVDVDTERRIVEALRDAYFGGTARTTTLVLCSHRLAAFPHADRIIVLDKGRVLEEGTHEALIAAGGMYARIYQAQHRIEKPRGEANAS